MKTKIKDILKKYSKNKLALLILSLCLYIAGVVLSWYCYGWQLPLIILIFMWAGNLERDA